MCVRLSFVSSTEKLLQELNIQPDGVLRTSYNILPTQHAYIIRNTSSNQLDYVTWGMIPQWSVTGKNEGKLTHARAENIITSTSFRIPIRQKRCLILVDSFYDFLGSGQIKDAFRFFHKSNQILTIAGVWDAWLKDGYELRSFSIITSKDNEDWPVRMPVILDNDEDRKKWLSDISVAEVLDLLNPPTKNTLDYYKISADSLLSNMDCFELHLKIDR